MNELDSAASWLEQVHNLQIERDTLRERIAQLEAVLRETTEADLHEDYCPHVTGMGPCDCLTGRIQAALPPTTETTSMLVTGKPQSSAEAKANLGEGLDNVEGVP